MRKLIFKLVFAAGFAAIATAQHRTLKYIRWVCIQRLRKCLQQQYLFTSMARWKAGFNGAEDSNTWSTCAFGIEFNYLRQGMRMHLHVLQTMAKSQDFAMNINYYLLTSTIILNYPTTK